MKLSRLRSGELIALAAAVLLVVILGLDWYFLSTPDARVGAHESGIRALGWFAVLLILVAILLTLASVVTTAMYRATSIPVVLTVLATAFALLATLIIGLRLVAQPGLGVGAGNLDVDVELPAYLGFLTAAAMTYGVWRAMGDERTDAEESKQQTEEVLNLHGGVKPAPPAHAVPGSPD